MDRRNIKSSEELEAFIEYIHQEKRAVDEKLKLLQQKMETQALANIGTAELRSNYIKLFVQLSKKVEENNDRLKRYIIFLYLLIILFAIVLAIPFKANASPTMPPFTFPKHGIDVLGIHHRLFPCDILIELTPEYTPLGLLSDPTFGDSDQCFRRYLREIRPSYIRAHLLNTTAVRNGKTQPQEPLYKYTLQQVAREVRDENSAIYQKIAVEISKINIAVAEENPGTVQYLSPLLEHDLSPQDEAIMFRILLKKFPGQIWVSNPVNNNNPTPANTFKEKHNKDLQPNPSADIVSQDGVSFWDTNVPDGLRKVVKGVLHWMQPWNIRAKIEDRNGTPVFIPPRLRTWIPTRAEIALAIQMLQPKPALNTPVPPQCGNPRPRQFTRNEVWKISSDNHGKGDSKDAKPLLITYQRSSAVDILNKNGQTIGRMPYYGSFSAGGFRYYYRDRQAYDLGQLAENTSGSSNIFLRINGACYLVNAYHREGTFR